MKNINKKVFYIDQYLLVYYFFGILNFRFKKKSIRKLILDTNYQLSTKTEKIAINIKIA